MGLVAVLWRSGREKERDGGGYNFFPACSSFPATSDSPLRIEKSVFYVQNFALQNRRWRFYVEYIRDFVEFLQYSLNFRSFVVFTLRNVQICLSLPATDGSERACDKVIPSYCTEGRRHIFSLIDSNQDL